MRKSLIGLLLGLIFSLSLTYFAGENPLNVLQIIFKSAFGSPYDFGLTLYYSSGLIFTGLSVSLAYKVGLFNIGAEGQLLMGSLATTVFALAFPHLPFPWAPLLAALFGLLVGGLWALVPAVLKVFRGSHEVVVTMMMNFIAASLTSWVILNFIPNPESQNPESKVIPSQYLFQSYDFIKQWTQDSPASIALVFALICALVLWIFDHRTKWGYELKICGLNPAAAERAGIPFRQRQIEAFVLSGALAGGVALVEVLGNSGQYKMGFSPDFGFIGIAVALMARNHPLGIIFSALLMGALHKGSSDLDFETNTITRDFSKIIQGLIILFVAIESYRIYRRRGPRGLE